MEIPGLGLVTEDEDDWLSEPIAVPGLRGHTCRFIVRGYEDDERRDDFHAAIANFLQPGQDLLSEAEPHVFRYYEATDWGPRDDGFIVFERNDLWSHVQLGDSPVVRRRRRGDRAVYVSLECNCDWEVEHGLQIVFRNGRTVSKVGPYNGHLTNSDAYNDERLEHVIYRNR